MKATPREYEILESLLHTTGGDFGIELTKAKLDDKEQILFIISNPGEPKLILKIEKEEPIEVPAEDGTNKFYCGVDKGEEVKNEKKNIPESSQD